MKHGAVLILLLGLSAPAGAQTLGERLATLPQRADALSEKVVILDSKHSAFLIPLASNVAGRLGTYFRSDISIVNASSAQEEIAIYWFAAGQNNCLTGQVATKTLNAKSIYAFRDIVGQLQLSGVGSIIAFAGPPGMPDTLAQLDASSRLWTPYGSGTTSISFPSVGPQDLSGSVAAYAIGLRNDDNFRTNVGLVNMDLVAHVWTVSALGTIGQTSFQVTVPGCSMNQFALPNGNYGDLSVAFKPDASGFGWSAYGVSVDNVTGSGWASHATQ